MYKKILNIFLIVLVFIYIIFEELVWEKLAKIRGVKIHGWYNNNPVNIDYSKDDEMIYITPTENKNKQHDDTKHLSLIGYK